MPPYGEMHQDVSQDRRTILQMVKHVLREDQDNTQALRLVLRCLDLLRSLRIDAILSGGSKKANRVSRPELDAVEEPTNWDKV